MYFLGIFYYIAVAAFSKDDYSLFILSWTHVAIHNIHMYSIWRHVYEAYNTIVKHSYDNKPKDNNILIYTSMQTCQFLQYLFAFNICNMN